MLNKISNLFKETFLYPNSNFHNKMIKLVLQRHGESVWNKENKFTGWTDVGLTEKGRQEAVEAGKTPATPYQGPDVAAAGSGPSD